MTRRIVLDNGVRVVMERLSSLKSVAIGVWINVGTRDEKEGEGGISHFLEHMMFKGTRRRSATRISQEIDSLGGEMNAFTTHESTTLYVKVLDQQIKQAIDLLFDLFHFSRLDSKEIQREKQVVLEEIRSVRDDPEDLVQELHAKEVLRGHPLGRPILGNRLTMQNIQRTNLMRFRDLQYCPAKTVIAVAGNFQVNELTELLNKSFGSWKSKKPQSVEAVSVRPPKIHRGTFVHPKQLEQIHLCLGFKGISTSHPQRYAAHTLNALLGGGVSSRLFQEIREKRGLAYTIYSQLSSFADVGTLTIYAATAAKEADSVVGVICKEVEKLRKKGPGSKELERTKNQLKGTVMLGLEGTYGRMNKLAKDEICQGRTISLQEMISEIDHVSCDQIKRLGQQLLDFDALTVTALGPIPKSALSQGVGALS
ncbi:MAG: pitrilysin family protein [Nitrospirota bacterium]|nr:pitrilysin family protein [Nitrospirota bacterium]